MVKYDDMKFKKPKEKKFTDDKGHIIDFSVEGDYEAVILKCFKCNRLITLLKVEVDAL